MKQETLEEAAEKEFPLIDTEWCRTDACEEENLHLLGHRKSFIKGAKWQQEQDKNKYSEEEVKNIVEEARWQVPATGNPREFTKNFDKWFEQFKKK